MGGSGRPRQGRRGPWIMNLPSERRCLDDGHAPLPSARCRLAAGRPRAAHRHDPRARRQVDLAPRPDARRARGRRDRNRRPARRRGRAGDRRGACARSARGDRAAERRRLAGRRRRRRRRSPSPTTCSISAMPAPARLLMGILAEPSDSPPSSPATPRCARRPMGRVIEPLSAHGRELRRARGRPAAAGDHRRRDPVPIDYRLPVASAQVKSAVLLAGLNAPGDDQVIEPRADPRPHRAHARAISARRSTSSRRRRRPAHHASTASRSSRRRRSRVPGDPSSAAFPLVAALIVPGSEVTLEGVGVNPLRTGLFETLREMGADIAFAEPRATRAASRSPICASAPAAERRRGAGRAGADDDRRVPDPGRRRRLRRGRTVMRGLGELRVKESDRLAAIAAGLAACGVAVEIEGDDADRRGRRRAAAAAAPDRDPARPPHRHGFLVLGLAARRAGARSTTPRTIATSFPVSSR